MSRADAHDELHDAAAEAAAPDTLAPGWQAHRFARVVELVAEPDCVREGAELQRLNRAPISRVEPGLIEAYVRERSSRPRRVVIKSPTLPDEVWERFIEVATERPPQLARLLAGELPGDIDALVAGASGDRLFPPDADLKPECRCDDPRRWCRHACAVALSFASTLRERPFEIFSLRGLHAGEVIERLRQRRAAAARAIGPTPAYTQRPAPGADDVKPLEVCLDDFWTPGKGLQDLDTTARRPEVSCPLLRRLGPSPFTDGKFPLLGLLATCYETISESAVADQSRADSESAADAIESDPDA